MPSFAVTPSGGQGSKMFRQYANVPAFHPLRSEALDVRVGVLENYITLLVENVNWQHQQCDMWNAKDAIKRAVQERIDELKDCQMPVHVSDTDRKDEELMVTTSTSYAKPRSVTVTSSRSVDDRPSSPAWRDSPAMTSRGGLVLRGSRPSTVNNATRASSCVTVAPTIQRKDVSTTASFDILNTSTARHEMECLEIKLSGTVWDVLVFVQMGIMNTSEDLAVVILAVLNFVLQAVFTCLVQANLVVGTFSEPGIVEQVQDWRVVYAHDPRYADPINNTPLAKLVCTRNPHVMEGAQQASRFHEVHDYLHIIASIRSGTLMCMLANTLWIFTCIREVHRCFQFIVAVWIRVYDSGDVSLVGLMRFLSGRSIVFVKKVSQVAVTIEGEVTRKAVDMNIGFTRGVLLTCVVFLPRVAILAFLAVTGVQFLVATTELREIILNAVALEVVLHVDELIYELFVPAMVQEILKQTYPFRLAHAPDSYTTLKPWIQLGIVAGVLAIIRCVFLEPLITNLEDARHVMCGGSTDFLAFETALGPVAAGRVPDTPGINRSSYVYRAIFQRTRLHESCFSSCLYLDSDQGATPFPLRSVVSARIFQSLSVQDIASEPLFAAAYGVDCFNDLAWVRNFGQAAEGAIFEAIKEKMNDPHASSCPYLEHEGWCLVDSPGGEVARFFCPKTCGLDVPTSGNPYWKPRYGVPSDCDRVLGDVLNNTPCADANISITPSAFANYAKGFNELAKASFEKLSQGNTSHQMLLLSPIEQFGKFGCPWLLQKNDASKWIQPLSNKQKLNIPETICSPQKISKLGRFKTARYLCPVACACATVLQVNSGTQFVPVVSGRSTWIADIGATLQCPRRCFGVT